MSAARIAFLVTHLMGSGHLKRVVSIARALKAEGAEALVISGGRPLPWLDAAGVEIVQLPPLQIAGLDYGRLLTPDGTEADAACMAARIAGIETAVRDFAPQALATELYPFGRRILAAEFEAAAAARPAGCALAVSVRDAPEPPKPEKRAIRTAEAAARIAAYDMVLVHGDRRLLPLEAAWPGEGAPLPEEIAARVFYTGYVAPERPASTAADPDGEVLVSVGAGAVGRGLLEVAARASALQRRPWRLIVGGEDADTEAARLATLGPATVETPRADFADLMARAAVSVSLAGYNTALEAALRGGPSILVPMAEGGEKEQTLRAAAFAALPGIMTLESADLTPKILAAAVETALAAHPAGVARPDLQTDGARVSAAALIALAEGFRPE